MFFFLLLLLFIASWDQATAHPKKIILGEAESSFSIPRVLRQVRDELLVSKMVIISIFELRPAL